MLCFVIDHTVAARILDPGLTGCVSMHLTTSPQMPIGKITFAMFKAAKFLMWVAVCEYVSLNNIETRCHRARSAALRLLFS